MFSHQRRQTAGLMNLGGALVAALALVVGTGVAIERYQAGAPAPSVDAARCELVCRTAHEGQPSGNKG